MTEYQTKYQNAQENLALKPSCIRHCFFAIRCTACRYNKFARKMKYYTDENFSRVQKNGGQKWICPKCGNEGGRIEAVHREP